MNMNQNNQSGRAALRGRLANGFALVCMLLGMGLTNLMAQDAPASFVNLINGEVTNDVTVEPGQTFVLQINIETTGLVDGVTATLNFDPAVLQVQGGITDLSGPFLPFPFANEVDNTAGYITLTKARFGGGNEGNFPFMSLTFVAGADIAVNTTTTIDHLLTGNDQSNIVFFGNELLENAPSVNVLVDAGVATPPNDEPCNAEVVECGSIVSGTTEFATSTGAPADFCGTGSNASGGVWYTLTGTDQNVTASLCGSSFDTKIQVYSGACDALICQVGNDDACGVSSEVSFGAAEGTTYWIYVFGFGNASAGEFSLAITCNDIVEAPANDLCGDAIALACGQSVTGTNVGATGGSLNCGGPSNGVGVWYSYSNDVETIVTLTTCNENTDFDTDITVYTGGCDELSCFQYTDGTAFALGGCTGSFPLNFRAGLQFTAQPGVEYLILVDGYEDIEVGNFQMDVACEEIVCTSPSLVVGPVDANGGPLDVTCLPAGTPYFVSVSFEGGSGNSSYNVVLNGGAPVEVAADESAVLGPIAAGTAATVVATGAQDALCSATGSVTIAVCGPENDTPCTATEVECSGTYAGTNIGATPAPAGEFCDGSSLSGIVYYTYTNNDANDVIFQFSTCNPGTTFDTDAHLFTGPCDALTCSPFTGQTAPGGYIDGTLNTATGGSSSSTNCTAAGSTSVWSANGEVVVSPGQTIYLGIDGFSTLSGNFVLTINCIPLVCESPTLTLTAQDETGAPIDGCIDFGGSYFVTASLSGGSGNDSYTVTVNGASQEVAANGSAVYGPITVGTNASATATGVQDEACGALASLTSPAICPPSNDNCTDALEATCGGGPYSGTTIGATNVEGQEYCGTSAPSTTNGGVWYTLNIDATSDVDIDLSGSLYDTKVFLYSGTCDALACITGDDDGGEGVDSRIQTTLDAGSYLIYISGFSSARGEYLMNITCTPVVVVIPGCTNDAACNFNLEATEDDGSCVFADGPCEACLDGAVVTNDADGDGVCDGDEIPGCTNSMACNYNPEATDNDGSCILNGTACELADGSVGTLVNCECTPVEPGTCQDFRYYLADILADGSTNIYDVALSGTDAALTLIATSDIEVHIAYSETDKLIYAVSKADGSYRTLDPATAAWGPVTMINATVAEIIGAAINADGKLLISSQSANTIYDVDLTTQNVSVFDSYSPTLGGDIAFGSDGALYLATREGNGTLYLAMPDELMSDILLGSVPNLVTGIANMSTNQLILSSRDANTLAVRNYDGSAAADYNLTLDGEPFTAFNGDMASGCADDDTVIDECAYKLYYTHQPVGGSYSLLEVMLNNDGTTTNTELLSDLESSHIALTPDGSTIYMVGSGNTLNTYDVATNSIIGTVGIQTAGGMNVNGSPAAVCGSDGTLYIATGNKVYTVDVNTGLATQFGPDRTVNGGDLIFAPTGPAGAEELWIITRSDDKLTNVLTGAQVTLPATEINGAAVLENGNLLVADGNGAGLFKEISLADLSIVGTYETGLALLNGDLAGNCTLAGPDVNNPDCTALGACNATDVEYVQGTTSNGGALAGNRTDATQALGAPEGTDNLVFVSLGYGGSITLSFDGVVLNGAGDDIRVVETSFGNPGCAAYPEYADVSVSNDGVTWYFIGTVCKSDRDVDISDAEGVELPCVSYVRIANNDELTSTPDGFDVDGVVALHNCEDDGADVADNMPTIEAQGQLTSYPNPTAGPSQVVFVTAETGRTLVEVYDMNGRNVATLFNQEAQAGQEYRIDFDGATLPNGIYIYRMTTTNEIIIDKFMVAK